jgi:hypothetical protein
MIWARSGCAHMAPRLDLVLLVFDGTAVEWDRIGSAFALQEATLVLAAIMKIFCLQLALCSKIS